MSLGLAAMAAVNFANGYLDGLRKSKAYKNDARAYLQQAAQYRQNAANIRLNGALNEDVMRSKNRSHLADMVANASENGMGESPTMASSLQTAASALEQNVLNKRYQTESKAENSLYQARLNEENARYLKKKKRNAFQSGLISGIDSALGGLHLPMKGTSGL